MQVNLRMCTSATAQMLFLPWSLIRLCITDILSSLNGQKWEENCQTSVKYGNTDSSPFLFRTQSNPKGPFFPPEKTLTSQLISKQTKYVKRLLLKLQLGTFELVRWHHATSVLTTSDSRFKRCYCKSWNNDYHAMLENFCVITVLAHLSCVCHFILFSKVLKTNIKTTKHLKSIAEAWNPKTLPPPYL